jgi:hypothetical protein
VLEDSGKRKESMRKRWKESPEIASVEKGESQKMAEALPLEVPLSCCRRRCRGIGRTRRESQTKKEGIPKETVVKESFWRMRPDGIAVLPPVGNTAGTFCILEHK